MNGCPCAPGRSLFRYFEVTAKTDDKDLGVVCHADSFQAAKDKAQKRLWRLVPEGKVTYAVWRTRNGVKLAEVERRASARHGQHAGMVWFETYRDYDADISINSGWESDNADI